MASIPAIDEDAAWHEARPPERTAKVIGRDQNGRNVYSDHCVIVPGTRRPDGSRRKDQRIRAEQLPDGSWKSFVPQDEVQAFETRAHRAARRTERRVPVGYDPTPAAPVVVKKKPVKPKPVVEKAPVVEKIEEPKEEDPEKRMRNLKKKLKQVAELQAKVDAGLEADADQQAKLAKAPALQAELDGLEKALAQTSLG